MHKRKTDQSAGQVDTCRPRVGAVDPLGLWESKKPGACHSVVLMECYGRCFNLFNVDTYAPRYGEVGLIRLSEYGA